MGHPRFSHVLPVLFLTLCPSLGHAETDTVTSGNTFLKLVFRTEGEQLRAVRLVNELSHRAHDLRSDDFSVGIEGQPPLRSAGFALRDVRQEAVTGGQRLTVALRSEARGVDLDVIYELGDRDFFVRRWLEVSASQPLPLRQVDVWLVGLDGECSHQGFGEPVFLDDTFWGLEYPSGHNSFAAAAPAVAAPVVAAPAKGAESLAMAAKATPGVVTLTHYPGRTVNGRFVSKTAVLGVAEPGRVAQRFREYVGTFQVTPKDRNLFVNYNTWWTLMPPTEQNCLELIDLFKRKLFDPYGESFDTFTIDDGWDDKNSLWKIRSGPFPRGFQPLVEALRPMDARLGLWLSPSSGYSHAPWGAANGYEGNSNDWYLCQSGPKYRRGIQQVVTDLAKQYGLAFFKFDGFCPSCEAEGHGHLPGPYAVEANTDAYLELLTAVRQTRRDIFLDPTCGMWLSPWWLKYVDSIWGSVSDDYPDIIAPGPIVRDSATTTRDAVFRQRCREHPGYPPAAIEHLGIIVITPEKWEDNAVDVVGRGCRLLTLYLNPKYLRNEDRDWAFLASLLKWARHNAATLSNTELLPGDPFKREVYGYAHFRGGRGIMLLRNPFITPQTAKVRLDESAGWSRSEILAVVGGRSAFSARVVYPREEVIRPRLQFGDSVELQLQAYETVLVQVEPLEAEQPVLGGVRCMETERTPNEITYAVYGRAGQQATAALVSASAPRSAAFDGQPLQLAPGKGRTELSLTFPGEGRVCSVSGEQPIEARTEQGKWQLTGACTAAVPAGVQATMHVLCDPRNDLPNAIECAAVVAGKPVEVRVVGAPGVREQAHTSHTWTWFEFPVPPGRSEVSVTLRATGEGGYFRGEVGWWLWVEQPLVKRLLTLEWTNALAPPSTDPLPLPVNMESERQLLTIQEPTVVRAGNRWGDANRPVVYLDGTAPDESSQAWGKLQRNQSVWEKEMLIGGRKFTRGLGTHANGRLMYDLTGSGFRTFRSLVGRDEHAGDGRVAFQVRVDGKLAFDSGPMTRASVAKPVEVDLTGGNTLELLTNDGGDGFSGDHGNWAEARLER
jgi:hypothetical protein